MLSPSFCYQPTIEKEKKHKCQALTENKKKKTECIPPFSVPFSPSMHAKVDGILYVGTQVRLYRYNGHICANNAILYYGSNTSDSDKGCLLKIQYCVFGPIFFF